jgi:hypothetical protein
MWGEWKSDIDILDHQRWLKLEIDFATLKGELAQSAYRRLQRIGTTRSSKCRR